MSSSDYRRQAPPAVMTTEGPDEDYDYSAALRRKSYEQSYKNQTAARRTPPKPENPARASRGNALLDLEQLEELHEEAERMKALGNKHMASQVCTIMLWFKCTHVFKKVSPKLSSGLTLDIVSPGFNRNLLVRIMHTRLPYSYLPWDHRRMFSCAIELQRYFR